VRRHRLRIIFWIFLLLLFVFVSIFMVDFDVLEIYICGFMTSSCLSGLICSWGSIDDG